jgi:hypothetical protein
MTLSNKYRKDFETWVNEGHNSNPRMLKREPEDKDSYATKQCPTCLGMLSEF